MEIEDHQGGQPNTPQETPMREFLVITDTLNSQQTNAAPETPEARSHAHALGYDSYKPDYNSDGSLDRVIPRERVYQSDGLTSTGPLSASTYRPAYRGEASTYRPHYDRQELDSQIGFRPEYQGQGSSYIPAYSRQRASNVHHGQDDQAATTTRDLPNTYPPVEEISTQNILPDTYRPHRRGLRRRGTPSPPPRGRGRKKARDENFERDLEQVLRENNLPSQLMISGPGKSQDLVSTAANAHSPDSLNFSALAITPKPYFLLNNKQMQNRAVNLLRARQQAEKATVANQGRTGPSIIDQPLHTGHRITKSTKEETVAKRVRGLKKEPPPFSILDDGWLNTEAEAVMRLLADRTNETLSQPTIQYHRRRLKAIEFDIADLEMDNEKAQKLNKNHEHIIFSERQAAAKFLFQYELQRDTMLSAAQIDQSELEALNKCIRKADVDYHYTLYHPVMYQYGRLYDGTTSAKRVCKIYKPGQGIEVGNIHPKKVEKPEMWYKVPQCMKEGTLEGLRLAIVTRGKRGGPTTVVMGTPTMDMTDQQTKWKIADPADLDVENAHKIDEEDEGGKDAMKMDEDSDSDDDGGVRI